jgi:hypothetical protein
VRDVLSLFQQMRGKGMSEGVAAGRLADPRSQHGPVHGFLYECRVQMVAFFPLGAGIVYSRRVTRPSTGRPMLRVSVSHLRQNLPAFLRRVQAGEEIQSPRAGG